MILSNLVECVSAVYLSYFVQGDFKERGGLMMVAPPASLKSSVLDPIENYASAKILSDISVKQAIELREDISACRITTLAFSDYEKLYQRHTATSSNTEGVLKAMVAEGFRQANFEDSRLVVTPARCAIIGCMTKNFYNRAYPRWIDDGFARRFLWFHYQLEHPDIITDSIDKWIRLQLAEDGFDAKVPHNRVIPYDLSPAESAKLLQMMKYQQGKEIGYILLKKMACALKWKWRKQEGKAWDILEDFAPGLSKDGTVLKVPANAKKEITARDRKAFAAKGAK